MSQVSRTVCRPACTTFYHPTPSLKNFWNCSGHSCCPMINARLSLRCRRKMQGFSSKSSTGYASFESSWRSPNDSPYHLAIKTLRAAKLEIELREIAFSVLRRLCGRIGYLPESYLLSNKFDLSENLSEGPDFVGSFADVRKGAFKGKDVAVKSSRVAERDDKMKIRKVRVQAVDFHSGPLTYCAAVLQRGCHVEELVSSERPRSHWSPRHPRRWKIFYGVRMDGQR